MFVIRPIKENDLDNLMNLLKESGHGLTSLPKDKKIIADKIEFSERSFSHRKEGPAGESYLFVMEELFTGRIVGVSGLISKIGGFQAYYFYRLTTDQIESKMLNIKKTVKTLTMEKTHSGPAEICSLFLAPDYRNSQNGRFLSLSRFLFMAEDKEYFENEVIAEMRGRVNKNGESPFWNSVGKKFMDIDFLEADYLTMKSKSFIDELLPKHPILVDLLPEEAQEVVAQVHPDTAPARHILEQEGFKFNGLVGIFEPGPVLEAKLSNVRAFKESKVVTIKDVVTPDIESEVFVISTSGKDKKFKSTLGNIQFNDDETVNVHAVTATALKLKVGENLRYVSLKPKKANQQNLEL